jgi:nucleoside-diphosphate-sugar epimerase
MSNQQAAASFTDKLALGEAKRGENKRRVVVTGGSGKLGRATVKYLSDEGWEVISVDTRRPPTASEDGKTGIGGAYRLVEIDLEDMGAVIETFMTTDMVSGTKTSIETAG